MSLKDNIRWVEPYFIITKDGKQRYQPVRQRDMVAWISVKALRARLEADLDPEWGGNEYVEQLLAELEVKP